MITIIYTEFPTLTMRYADLGRQQLDYFKILLYYEMIIYDPMVLFNIYINYI